MRLIGCLLEHFANPIDMINQLQIVDLMMQGQINLIRQEQLIEGELNL